MAQRTASGERVRLDVENIGGITERTVELAPGVTVLTGRNATNRTSLLQAIMAALGGDGATLKGDADDGGVELTIGDATYTRRLRTEDGTTVTGGDPYLADAALADLFAFLLETNEARMAVARGEDLRDVIMRPVDTDEIEKQIDDLQSQRDDIDTQISEIQELKQQLPNIESHRYDIKEDITEKKDKLRKIEEEMGEIDEDVGDERDRKEEFESKLQELNDTRADLERIRHQLDSQRDSYRALEVEREELEAEREEYEAVPDSQLDGIQDDIDRLHQQKDRLNSRIDEIQTVIQFNENLLDGSLDVLREFRDEEGAVTEKLLDDGDDLRCWTCGSETDTGQVESMLGELRELRNRYMDRRGDVDARIEDRTEERRQLDEKRRQRSQIDTRLETIEAEIRQRESRIDDLENRRETLVEDVESLEAAVEGLQVQDEQDSELLERHKEANRLEVEIERLEGDLDAADDEIEAIEERVAEHDRLTARREEILTDIESLRTRVQRLEQGAIDQFNDHMERVLDVLDYDNLERIWIERAEREAGDRRGTVTQAGFDLHVVRRTESGSVYEDSVDHLSESEREVTGLVFALAGYLAHEVHEQVPFILLDSVEAIDARRIADLVEYFETHADYLVVALLEEDAQALEGHRRVTAI